MILFPALHYMFENDQVPNAITKNRITLYETGWFIRRGNTQIPATREDFLRVLSNIDSILVRATVAQNMATASLSRVNMDIAVPQMTGGPLVQGAEECRCPPGYRGFSCEECAVGYYRDTSDTSRGQLGTCVKCPCNSNEQACGRGPTGRVMCQCKDGWGGPYCDSQGK